MVRSFWPTGPAWDRLLIVNKIPDYLRRISRECFRKEITQAIQTSFRAVRKNRRTSVVRIVPLSGRSSGKGKCPSGPTGNENAQWEGRRPWTAIHEILFLLGCRRTKRNCFLLGEPPLGYERYFTDPRLFVVRRRRSPPGVLFIILRLRNQRQVAGRHTSMLPSCEKPMSLPTRTPRNALAGRKTRYGMKLSGGLSAPNRLVGRPPKMVGEYSSKRNPAVWGPIGSWSATQASRQKRSQLTDARVSLDRLVRCDEFLSRRVACVRSTQAHPWPECAAM